MPSKGHLAHYQGAPSKAGVIVQGAPTKGHLARGAYQLQHVHQFMGLQILSQTMCVRSEPYDMQAPLPENLDRHGATKKHLLTCSGYAGLETTEARGKLWVAFSCLWVSFSCLWVSFSCLWVPFSFFVGLLFLRGAKQSARCGSSFLACESDALFCLVIYFV